MGMTVEQRATELVAQIRNEYDREAQRLRAELEQLKHSRRAEGATEYVSEDDDAEKMFQLKGIFDWPIICPGFEHVALWLEHHIDDGYDEMEFSIKPVWMTQAEFDELPEM